MTKPELGHERWINPYNKENQTGKHRNKQYGTSQQLVPNNMTAP
jgi:hypothetical protein